MADEKIQSFDDALGRLRLFFAGLSFTQRLWLAGGVVVVAGTLYAFVNLLSQPNL
jgi:hypothetical protein